MPSGDWLHTEAYLTLSGWVLAAPAAQEAIRQQLLTAIPTTSTIQLNYLGRGWDVDKCIFVRRYDRPTFTKEPTRLRFSIPLVAPDPNKYGSPPATGAMGVFTGADWYETFSLNTNWNEQFVNSSGWGETFSQTVPPGPYPTTLSLTSGGSITSHRLTVSVVGPLTAGDWRLAQLSGAGQEMWCNATLSAGQVLTIDCMREVATLAGGTVPLFGDMFTLEPGTNTYRLTSATQNLTAYATVTAYPAYM